MSIRGDPSEAMKEAPPCRSECELTDTGLRPTRDDKCLSLLLNQVYSMGTKPPGVGMWNKGSDSYGR